MSTFDMSMVVSRDLHLKDSRPERKYINHYINALESSIQEGASDNVIKPRINKIMNYEFTKENANLSYAYLLNTLSSLQEKYPQIYRESMSLYQSSVLPYIEDMNAFLQELDQSSIDNTTKNTLTETANNYKVADRILANHAKMKKRFTFESSVLNNQNSPINETCDKICNIIDTYAMKPYAKMAVAFEELAYLNYKFNIPNYDENRVVKSVTEYFIFKPDNTGMMDKYKSVIENSKVLSHDNTEKYLSYFGIDENYINQYNLLEGQLTKPSATDPNSIDGLIERYKAEEVKDDSKFKHLMRNIFAKKPDAIVYQFPDIVKVLRTAVTLGVLSASGIAGITVYLTSWLASTELNRQECKRLYNYIRTEQTRVEKSINDEKDPEKKSRLQAYSKELDKALNSVNDYSNKFFSDSEDIDDGTHDTSSSSGDDDFGLDFDLESYLPEQVYKFKMNSLMNDSIAAGDMIEKLAKDSLARKKAKKTNLKDDLKRDNLTAHLDENGKIDFVISSYDTSNCDCYNDIMEMADAIVKICNNMLHKSDSKLHYTMTEGSLDFRLRSKYAVAVPLTENDEDIMPCNVDLHRMFYVAEDAAYMDAIEKLDPNSIIESLVDSSTISHLSQLQERSIVDAWSIGTPIDKDIMDEFVNKYVSYQKNTGHISEALSAQDHYRKLYINENANPQMVYDSLSTMKTTLVTEAVNLNSIKLAVMGLKKKLKTASAKEQELSRDLDMNFNNFAKSMESLYKTDYREQIIKGQSVPSFSKLIKIAILLTGMGVATGNIALPAITAFAGIALSKHSSNKEKQAILDELEIEQKVLERELNKVEGGQGSTKKYRQLLTMQRNLMREEQRIKYGLSRKNRAPIQPLQTSGGK